MAHKLTEQEHAAVVSLAKLLGRELPSKQRSVAGGIASGLVRQRKNPIPSEDVDAVLSKYGAGQETLDSLQELGVLEPVPSGDGYLLTVSPVRQNDGEKDAPGSDSWDTPTPADKNPQPVADDTSAPASDAALPADDDKNASAPSNASAQGIAGGDASTATDKDPCPAKTAQPKTPKSLKSKSKSKPKPSPATKTSGGRKPSKDAGKPATVAAPAQTATAPARIATASAQPVAKPATATLTPLARRETRTLAHLNCVRKQTPEVQEIRRQIIDLDPRLWINGWLLSTPEAFLRFERELRGLDAELSGRPTLGDGTLSLRELSYRVFGDEKFLAPESDGRKLLHLMGLTDIVRTRPQVRMELLHHIPKHHRHLRLVVSENLDPWVNMRDAMFRGGRKRIFDERVHGVVFGNGYLVDDPHKLPDLIASLGAEDVTVLYWGDLDRAGLQILARLVDLAGDRFSVEPLVAAYRLMLKRAMERYPNPLENEPTDQAGVTPMGLELLEPHLKDRELEYLRVVLDNALLIPQEILTAEDL